MANSDTPGDKKEFRCIHCDGKVLVPWHLPPTTAPCPYCGGVITSPAAPTPAPAPATVQAPYRSSPPPPPPPEDTAPPPPPAPAQPQVAPPAPVWTPPVETLRKPVEIPADASAPPKPQVKPARPAPIVQSAPPPKSGLIPVMLVLLLLILGGGTAAYFISKEMRREIPPPTVRLPDADVNARDANYIRIGWQKDATKLLRDFMAAGTSREKLPFILNGETLASRLEDFYGGVPINDSDTPAEAFSIYELSEDDRKRGLFMMIYDQPPQFEMKEFFRPLAPLEVQYGLDEADLLLSTFARSANFAMEPMRVHAFFKRTTEGLKLDWEIFAQTKYRTFQNFVELPETGQTGVFRVFVVEDVPDKNHHDASIRTYRLSDPANTGDSARINVKVDSEAGRMLSLINWRGTKRGQVLSRTATVQLSWTGKENAPQLELSRFICWEFLGLGGDPAGESASAH